MADGIQTNPLLALLPETRDAAARRPEDEGVARTWTAVNSLVAFVRALLGLLEFHLETISKATTRIPHRLGRRPVGRIILWQSENKVAYDSHELWTDQKVAIHVAAGTMRVFFVLFVVVISLAGSVSQA